MNKQQYMITYYVYYKGNLVKTIDCPLIESLYYFSYFAYPGSPYIIKGVTYDEHGNEVGESICNPSRTWSYT